MLKYYLVLRLWEMRRISDEELFAFINDGLSTDHADFYRFIGQFRDVVSGDAAWKPDNWM